MQDRGVTRAVTGRGRVDQNGEQMTGGGLAAEGPPAGRSARKRQAIMEAATALFLRDGYRNTSMDQVAADAAVSKQTVYKHFADKEQLFREIVLGVTGNSEAIITGLTSVLRSTMAARSPTCGLSSPTWPAATSMGCCAPACCHCGG